MDISYTFEDSNGKTAYLFDLNKPHNIRICVCRIDKIVKGWMMEFHCNVKYSHGQIDWDSCDRDCIMSYEAKHFAERIIRLIIFM
jgi:hypothetical protein